MTIAILVTLALAAGLIIYAVAKAYCWLRTPTALRGDWWGRFERQFQAYASVTDGSPTGYKSRS
jgi:cytochrome c-type biogenesis protein CcmE